MSGNPLMTETPILLTTFDLGETTMMIKDLSASKELDSKAMAKVRGGGAGISSSTTAVAGQDVTNLGFGAAVGVQETKAFSQNILQNSEDNSSHFNVGLPPYHSGPYYPL